ncbi:circadian clock-controlled protein daywake [Augochlora pura]
MAATLDSALLITSLHSALALRFNLVHTSIITSSNSESRLVTHSKRVNACLLFNRANIDALRFVIELDFESLSLEGEYDIDGKVILLRIHGSGPVYGNFTNCKGQVKLQAATSEAADGQHSVKIVDFKTRIAVGGGRLKLENLFGGDPALGEAVNVAINSNFDAFIKELQPSLESAISDTFLKIANGILTQFTYETLFPI